MEIRSAQESDWPAIVALYERSQHATGLPDPAIVPPGQLASYLLSRTVVERIVAVDAGTLIGHCIIEPANPQHLTQWRRALGNIESPLLELGGAFVEPSRMTEGIGSELLAYSLETTRKLGAVPVSATWEKNEHVKRMFMRYGAQEAGTSSTYLGMVSLFVF